MRRKRRVYLSDSEYEDVSVLAGLLKSLECREVQLGDAVGRATRFMKAILEKDAQEVS